MTQIDGSLDVSSGPAVHFPVPRECPFDPPELYLELQRERPVARVSLPTGQLAWLVTRHEDARRALEDPRLSADMSKPGFPVLYEHGVQSPLRNTFMRVDGEAHMRVRRVLNKEFTIRRVEQYRPMVERIVEERLAALREAGRGADLVELVAGPAPSQVICEVLGVPLQDRRAFAEWTATMTNTRSTPEEVGAAAKAIYGFLDGVVRAKETDPGDDLVSRLLAEARAGALHREEITIVVLLILVAGHETTSTMIGLGVLALLEHRDQLELLRATPQLLPNAVEELLRHQTIMQVPITRAVVEDIEIGGQRIAAGEGVLILLGTANRDPDEFTAPEQLDLTRRARSHLAFSFGPHACLGHALARLELQVVLSGLLTRFPGLALGCSLDELTFRPHTVGLFGVNHLPVTW